MIAFVIIYHQENHPMKLVYIHIPKTSGSAFRSSLLKNYSRGEYFICTGGNRTVRDYLEHSLDAFHNLTVLSSIRLFLGHMPYGIDKSIQEDCSYFTFLREPLDRVLSEYFYIISTTENQNHAQVKNSTISDYITGNIFLPNLQSRMISGNLDPDATDQEIAKAAIYNLEHHFDFVGIYEDLANGIKKFEETYPLKIGEIPKLNITNRRLKVSDLDSKTLGIIADRNAADIAVYQWALIRFSNNR